ncbi:hypothetical protein HYH03_007445 [Edaphochlamys debaryana]|uniref:Uncharacterized protein n=1 Tax=Edaphochlamys debaryana TaxID=47281 RepID=A0A835Y396_9CHLO|nr:hypothetical protein HYH03_007445 [Edaphochlamys debaryana]|eukprot:KAG2494392.1 hypothetical protein HYH03_007445 [Edaphochlamys debaryana]
MSGGNAPPSLLAPWAASASPAWLGRPCPPSITAQPPRSGAGTRTLLLSSGVSPCDDTQPATARSDGGYAEVEELRALTAGLPRLRVGTPMSSAGHSTGLGERLTRMQLQRVMAARHSADFAHRASGSPIAVQRHPTKHFGPGPSPYSSPAGTAHQQHWTRYHGSAGGGDEAGGFCSSATMIPAAAASSASPHHPDRRRATARRQAGGAPTAPRWEKATESPLAHDKRSLGAFTANALADGADMEVEPELGLQARGRDWRGLLAGASLADDSIASSLTRSHSGSEPQLGRRLGRPRPWPAAAVLPAAPSPPAVTAAYARGYRAGGSMAQNQAATAWGSLEAAPGVFMASSAAAASRLRQSSLKALSPNRPASADISMPGLPWSSPGHGYSGLAADRQGAAQPPPPLGPLAPAPTGASGRAATGLEWQVPEQLGEGCSLGSALLASHSAEHVLFQHTWAPPDAGVSAQARPGMQGAAGPPFLSPVSPYPRPQPYSQPCPAEPLPPQPGPRLSAGSSDRTSSAGAWGPGALVWDHHTPPQPPQSPEPHYPAAPAGWAAISAPHDPSAVPHALLLGVGAPPGCGQESVGALLSAATPGLQARVPGSRQPSGSGSRDTPPRFDALMSDAVVQVPSCMADSGSPFLPDPAPELALQLPTPPVAPYEPLTLTHSTPLQGAAAALESEAQAQAQGLESPEPDLLPPDRPSEYGYLLDALMDGGLCPGERLFDDDTDDDLLVGRGLQHAPSLLEGAAGAAGSACAVEGVVLGRQHGAGPSDGGAGSLQLGGGCAEVEGLPCGLQQFFSEEAPCVSAGGMGGRGDEDMGLG